MMIKQPTNQDDDQTIKQSTPTNATSALQHRMRIVEMLQPATLIPNCDSPVTFICNIHRNRLNFVLFESIGL